MGIPKRFFFIALLLVLFGCRNSDESSPPAVSEPPIVQEIRATGIDRFLGQTESRTEQQAEWEVHFFNPAEGRAICLFGAEYQISIRRGASNNVLFYLQGGGACWSKLTCIDLKDVTVRETAERSAPTGILDPTRPDNPFKDWNVVFVPYCDGSVFSGDNTLQYGDQTAYHHGLANLGAAITALQRTFPAPDKVLVAGSSAGGYGTVYGMMMAKLVLPNQSNWVLNDSGPGLQNPNDTLEQPQRNQNWPFPHFLPESCTSCPAQPAYIYEWAISRDPNLRVGMFSSLQDVVIRSFLLLDASGFEALLRQVTDDMVSRVGARLHRFFISGEMHTILLDPGFYDLPLNGVSMAQWAGAMVNNDDAAWPDMVAP
ncbi:MAG: hypothetical protein HY282_07880 [Nitrospirae bacterium]|nr:hypothetical protein [Candidatus Manganitrophaceae bacterium]